MRADTADLFLVDEGNSQLDSKAQNDFFRELVAREDRGTIIFVTHRLDAVKWADKVALVEGGTITEFGRPEELLAKEGSEWGKLWRGFEDK
jgi:ABC-type multidrug transport system fused ATPase/permease subunit